MKRSVDLLLDSGAFSAWGKGERIKLADYRQYLDRHGPSISLSVNLDVIPKRKTPEAVESAAEQSFKNWKRLQRAGFEFPILPVYHLGENPEWLRRYVGEGAEYLMLGGLKAATRRPVLEAFLDEAFSILCGSDGFPTVKVHGLGIHNVDDIFDYPWFSIDSSYWLYPGNFGCLLVPYPGKFGYDFSRSPAVFGVSEGKARIHARNQGGIQQKYIEDYLDTMGFTLEELSESYYARREANLLFYEAVAKVHIPKPFVPRASFFSARGKGEGLEPGSIRIYYVDNLDSATSVIMKRRRVRRRLLSYYFVRRKNLERYVRTGLVKERQRERL